MTTYTDTQLKQALAKMLPEKLSNGHPNGDNGLYYRPTGLLYIIYNKVKDTELLQLCWEVEGTLDIRQRTEYLKTLEDIAKYSYNIPCTNITSSPSRVFDWILTHSTWQQKVQALAQVKGVEVV